MEKIETDEKSGKKHLYSIKNSFPRFTELAFSRIVFCKPREQIAIQEQVV